MEFQLKIAKNNSFTLNFLQPKKKDVVFNLNKIFTLNKYEDLMDNYKKYSQYNGYLYYDNQLSDK